MTTRSEQPAALKRRIEMLEAQLTAQKERANKMFDLYRETLTECVEHKVMLDRIRRMLEGQK